MTQLYESNVFESGHVGQVDLANIEKNFATLRSSNSGASAPSNAEAGMVWFDDTLPSATGGLLKVRNDANNAWYAVLSATSSAKIWMYRNDSDDGWLIDATVTDRVIALKGGSGLYNRTGGGVAGETWANLKAHTHVSGAHYHDHNHQWYNYVDNVSDAQSWQSDGTTAQDFVGGTGWSYGEYIQVDNVDGNDVVVDQYTANDYATGTGNTGATNTADVRPAAAVGTLQYPDI